jgi:hypothetical protein
MTNNLLIEETLDELIKGMKSTNPRFTNLTFSHIHRNREAISFKICIVQSLCAKARIVAESFHRSIK